MEYLKDTFIRHGSPSKADRKYSGEQSIAGNEPNYKVVPVAGVASRELVGPEGPANEIPSNSPRQVTLISAWTTRPLKRSIQLARLLRFARNSSDV